MRYFYNIAFLLQLSIAVLAQDKDTVHVKPDFMPTGVRVGTDVIAIIKSSYDKTFKGWEINGDVDFYRYYLAVDFGQWGRTYQSDSANYTNNGNYFRVGVDVNFLKNDPDRNMFFFGFRYGASTFSEDFSVIGYDPYWGSLTGDFHNKNIHAHWAELTTGLRVKVWKMIWLGYTARLKFGLSTGSTPVMLPHDVPGYGRAEEDSYWGFNYQVLIRLPIRKSRSPAIKK